MAFPTYPTADSVEILLRSASFWPTDANKQSLARAQADIGAKAAADEWERLTGWKPFLMAPGAPLQSRPFDGTDYDGVLNLRGAAQEIAAVTFETRVLELERDFWLLASSDESDLAYEPPYLALRFLRPLVGAGLPAGLRVSARWGFCSQVPAYAYQQILQAASLIALTSVENLQSIADIGLDGFNKAFDVVGIITQKDLLTTWGKDFLKAAALHARTSAQ